MPRSDGDLLDLLHDTASAIVDALGRIDDWGLAGTRAGQHHSDLAADEAALKVLGEAEVGVLSEESGLHHADREVVVVVDPLDGSTNASLGIPWYAVSLCAVGDSGPRVALVVDLPRGHRYQAVRGAGAWVDRHRTFNTEAGATGVPLYPSRCTELADAVVGVSGYPRRHLGWRQYRALGALALDLCAVAAGTLDAYVDCSDESAHGPWDYLAGMLICQEAGAPVGDAAGRELVGLDHEIRRTPVAAGTAELYDQVTKARALT